jgi:transposase
MSIMNKEEKKYYVGIDVSKEQIDIYLLPSHQHFKLTNDVKGFKALIKVLSTLGEVLIVMEATGGYEKPVAKALKKEGLAVAVVNPRQIRDFAKALGKLAKTDKIDAHVIALFAEKIQPQPSFSIDENRDKLAELTARRTQLLDMITMERNRLDKLSQDGKKSINRVLKALQKELEDIQAQQQALIEQDTTYSELFNLFLSVKGIGTVVATTLIANLPELGHLSSRQIAALVGLAPFNHDSGKMRGKRAIRGGRVSVRCPLYMATLVAIRHNSKIKLFYQHLLNVGKLKKVAITACMRKLIVCLNAMVKNMKPWQTC